METKKATEKINETKSWFFEKIKLTNLQLESPKKKKRAQIYRIRNERITTDTTEIQRSIRMVTNNYMPAN